MNDIILVANRGEIACRIIATVQAMGRRAVAVYSDADRNARHVAMADIAVRLGPAPAAESYLNVGAILKACEETGATAVHPGYGFLSENAAFAERLAARGIAFIGPSPKHIRLFGEKHTARQAAEAAGVPLLPGTGLLASLEEAREAAEEIGYPVMLKSTAGGGGIGLQLCRTPAELPALFERATRLAGANFGDGRLFLERYVENARHIEVQIFGDGKRVVALGERDCSLQRRHQKVIEETPAPNLPEAAREKLHAAAVRLGEAVGYVSAGTVEFIYDPARQDFAFLEVNTRLQVEHPVTEAVTGIDLVAFMIRAAEGTLDLSAETIAPKGHAIEARLYAEDPAEDFRPAAGTITALDLPEGVRVDGWIERGTTVPPHYDPLLAKLIVHRPTRDEAIAALGEALCQTRVLGIATNADYLADIAAAPFFSDGDVATNRLATFAHTPRTISVLSPGMQSTLQDVPGRLGVWQVGVPPTGPMDDVSHRLANRILGNRADAPALEITLLGPTLRFHAPALIALTGAEMNATLDGTPVPRFTPVPVPAGVVLAIGTAEGAGLRATLAVRGGFDAAEVLGSRSTFTLGGFGGHATGALKVGDVLRLAHAETAGDPQAAPEAAPPLTNEWTLGVLYGPHGAPDFFTEDDIATLLSAPYRVGVNSARTGVRLIGPKPRFARPDGGEAGLHPSNIHDNAYAVGAIDFTGDTPIILGPDGPSLGGFVCPFALARAELWKLGQLRPGDTVRFAPMTLAEADAALAVQEAALENLAPQPALAAPAVSRPADLEPAIRLTREAETTVVYRRSGDDNILVEFGDNVLSLDLRVRVHALMSALEAEKRSEIVDLTPGIRSLQVHYDGRQISEARLLAHLDAIERALPDAAETTVPSRIVHLPLAFDDSQTRLATRRYRDNVRPDAPWCPSNLEFIRRINGLQSIDEVRDIVFAADYLVYGLGDVYLGAPVATPLDPRHRLVTTKYNPARTWTPENAVGIGGAYLCIYGMEGPGGYQFVGRTVQIFNAMRQTRAFRDGVPWLLRHFDRLRFYPVSESDLLEMRADFPHGRFDIEIEEGTLDIAAHNASLAGAADEIAAFRARRTAAFEAERERWAAAGLDTVAEPEDATPSAPRGAPAGAVLAPLPGVVWELPRAAGDRVAAGETVAVLEAMKMEVPVVAPAAGRIAEILVTRQHQVEAGEPILTLAAD